MKRPWNRVNLPVYSLSTIDGQNKPNMNICTYVTAISMQPKRFVIGLYEGTKTLENVRTTKKALLQLLSEQHIKHVPILGKKSGHKVNKLKRIQTSQFEEFSYIEGCRAIITVQLTALHEGGDHYIGVFDVRSAKNLNEEPQLYLDTLREKKIIRG